MATNNFLSSVEFKFVINRLPNVEFYVQQVNIPGISSGSTEIQTPFKAILMPGDLLTYDDLTLSIIADERMLSFKECMSWLEGITRPQDFTGYAALEKNTRSGLNAGKGITSSASLIVLNSNKNPSIKLSIEDMFPVSIGSISLNTTDSDINPPTFDVTFRYANYTIESL
jgi:hypothetical protein